MEPEGSLLHSQVPASSPYPEPAWSSIKKIPCTSLNCFNTLQGVFTISLQSTTLFMLFNTKTVYSNLCTKLITHFLWWWMAERVHAPYCVIHGNSTWMQ